MTQGDERRVAAVRDVPDDGHAFDALAECYDATFTDSPLGRELRRAVWSRLGKLPIQGRRWLDLGCGTGEDALWLCRQGATVLAVDASPVMLAKAALKSRIAVAAATVPRWETVDLNRPEPLSSLAGSDVFDAAIADFGSLNCVTDLPRLGAVLSRVLAPGAFLVAVTMGPFCTWEVISSLARGRPGRALRRWRSRSFKTRTGSSPLRYPSPRSLARALAPDFSPIGRPAALGLLLPPTDAAGFLRRRPTWLSRLGRLEDRLRDLPGAAWCADHYVITFRRRTDQVVDIAYER